MVKTSTVALAAAAGVAVVGIGFAIYLARGQPPGTCQGSSSLAASPSTVQVGQTALFTLTSPCLPTTPSISWDFGDGQSQTTTTSGNSHSYANQGTFTVVVTFIDTNGNPVTVSAQVLVNPIGINNVPTAISETESPSSVQPNQIVTISGTLTRTDTGLGIPNEPVDIQASPNQVNWTTAITVMTDAQGNYTGGIIFPNPGTYYIHTTFAGGPVV